MDGNFSWQLRGFLYNSLFLSGLASWMVSQLIKTVLAFACHSITDFKQLLENLFWRTGGMPSSHSALVSAVTTAIAFKHGISSDLFVFSCCFSLVVVRDAVGVRRRSGQQAHALNDLGKQASEKLEINFTPVKETRGHKPLEVIAGLVLGFLIAVAISSFLEMRQK